MDTITPCLRVASKKVTGLVISGLLNQSVKMKKQPPLPKAALPIQPDKVYFLMPFPVAAQ